MTGSTSKISIDYDDGAVQDALNRVFEAVSNTKPMMSEIAEYLHERTRENFDNETDPDGNAWAVLAKSTEQRKADQGVPINKILHGQSLHLRDTIFPYWDEDEAGVSTGPGTQAYAAAHQFGTEGLDIQVPAHKRRMTQAFGRELRFPVWASVGAYKFKGNLPARPYLGIGADDEREILEIIEAEILSAL
ncbi:MAG: phage virion morphogenesis protein [Nitrincola lacisaponensis]|uniref:phage virion morphogenesis protein n=1 Tax=Nitrincola lacisaponensis TaxID=267850 RepID=UPI003919EB85